MRERDRIEINAFKEQYEAEQRAKREEAERPIREAEAKLKETANALALAIRERIATGRDDEFQIDPATFKPIKGTAQEFNQAEAAKFLAANPDYYPSQENFQALTEYINRNAPNIILVSALQLEWAFKRLREYGLLRERPVPLAEPEKVRLYFGEGVEQRRHEPEPSSPHEQDSEQGWDLESGLPRTYSRKEISAMSADQYRRIFRLYTPAMNASLLR